MKIERVAFTGADESVKTDDILRLVDEYPTIKTEWALLVSKNNEGKRSRYPGPTWLEHFVREMMTPVAMGKLTTAAHLQGHWLREMTKGEDGFWKDRPTIAPFFNRYQLNWHGDRTPVSEGFFALLLELAYLSGMSKQFIFQMDAVNEANYRQAMEETDVTEPADLIVPLYDLSAGAGIVPDVWPKPLHPKFNGYAGGLGPDTIKEQMKRLEETVGDGVIWIDMETRIRSDDDRLFELDKCRRVLDAVAESKYV